MKAPRRMTKVLVTDDDAGQRMILRACLESDGYDVREAINGKDALEKLSEEPDIRLLLTDLAMPEMDGYNLIEAVRQDKLRYTYIIVLTSMEDRGSLLKALSLGADDYLTKPVYPDELRLRLKSGTRLIRLETQEELIIAMAGLSETRSDETGFHLQRVAHYTRLLAKDLSKVHPELTLNLSMADEIAKISPLHDIGKVAIPDNILHKPGKLTYEEFEIMKTHTTVGGNLLKKLYKRTNSYYLWLGYEIASFHHEKWNGRGYPRGLKGDKIPIAARIMAIADVYDAMTTKRCYKDAFEHEKVRNIILEEKGEHFDPRVVDAFLRQENAFLSVKEKFQENEADEN